MILNTPSLPQLVKEGECYLEARNVPNARRNAEWMLAHVLGCRNTDLYLHAERSVSSSQYETYKSLITRRGEREPLQYILGTTEFMSLEFATAPGVFVPRPETEVLVETAERMIGGAAVAVLDLCCGSGAIGVTLARRLPRIDVTLVDVDEAAAELAHQNAALNAVDDRCRVVRADALAFLASGQAVFGAIVCNPPYIRTSDIAALPPEVRDHEPLASLDGGPDGLDFIRRIVPALPPCLRPGAPVVMEIAPEQAEAVSHLLGDAGFADISVTRDYTGLDRVVAARKC